MKGGWVLALLLSASMSIAQGRVKTGDEVFVDKYLYLIKGKSIGVITNRSGELKGRGHIIDVLSKIPDVKLVVLFAPEHGIRGNAPNGQMVSDSVDEQTGVPIYSLYGKIQKPTPQMLKGVDVLIYDIQDVGVRCYTFISTLDLCLEAAAENGIKFIVLDRPDMLTGKLVDGPVLVDSLRSFVGIQPVSTVYGMTPGEFAAMINDGGMLKKKADLTVVKMENYTRDLWYDQTGLDWVTPSPNLPDIGSVEAYPGTVLLEATNVSEGRGTENPFETIGAPFIDSKKLSWFLNQQNPEGIRFEPVKFTPHSLSSAIEPKYNGVVCHGVKIIITDRNVYKPVEMGVTLLWAIHALYPDNLKLRNEAFDRLSGDPEIRLSLEAGKAPRQIISEWKAKAKQFTEFRENFLLYK